MSNEAKIVSVLLSSFVTWTMANWLNMALLLTVCSLPLGMENGEIKNTQITASSVKTSWFSTWEPSLARINQKGKINAWRAKVTSEKEGQERDSCC